MTVVFHELVVMLTLPCDEVLRCGSLVSPFLRSVPFFRHPALLRFAQFSRVI